MATGPTCVGTAARAAYGPMHSRSADLSRTHLSSLPFFQIHKGTVFICASPVPWTTFDERVITETSAASGLTELFSNPTAEQAAAEASVAQRQVAGQPSSAFVGVSWHKANRLVAGLDQAQL